ncbi:MAG: hypothetical protein LBT20_00500 [Clostridiales bacterium]|jgi:hypothetical protein|nr:hypothetical protein [Clostridiales bacterium]
MFINELFGKKVINSATAAYEGIVVGASVSCDLTAITSFRIAVAAESATGTKTETVLNVDPRSILSYKDALVTEKLTLLAAPPADSVEISLGIPVFHPNGTLYGYLVDLAFKKDLTVSRLIYDRPFSIRKILSVSPEMILAKAAVKRTAPLAQTRSRHSLKSLLQNSAVSNITKTEEEERQVFFGRYPRTVISGYAFLLGRTVGNDIRNAKNDIIIPSGSIITDTVVEKAGSYGKLVELTFSSIK